MNRIHSVLVYALLGAALGLLSACGGNNAEHNTTEQVKTVKLATVSDVPAFDEFTFPAVVSAVKTVDLSFEVSGRLVQMDIVAGSDIKQGHLLATIDPKPFQRRVEEQQTRRDQAERELKRLETMFKQNLVSQSTLDSAKTSFELAEIDLKNAQQDLSYTHMRAPFDAKVSQRLVENDSFVTAGQSIARLQDVSKIYFHINVPERLLTANINRGIDKAYAAILTDKDNWYPVTYVEHSTQPDPVAQTYEAVFAMAPSEQFKVTPGARAIVTVDLKGSSYPKGMVVPVAALSGDKDQGFNVWRYNAQEHTVSAVAVNVVHVQDGYAVLTNGLNIGDQVVAAGTSQMREGLTVKPYIPE